MNQKNDNLLTVVDVGSADTRVLVAELSEGALRYRGHSIVSSAGIRKGLVSDLEPASQAVNRAAMQAETSARAQVESCVVGVGGPHIKGVNSRGGVALGSRLREITRDDVRSALDRARSVAIPTDREILHLLPQEFILDDQPGIHDPVGMVGNRLEVNLHISTCSASAMQSLVTCCNRAGLSVEDTVFEPIAGAEATVSADERELGVCLFDIGAGSSELVVFFEGSVAHTATIPIGGDHFTNDLAVGLHVPVEEAERLKCNYGNSVVTSVSVNAEVELAGLPGYEPRMVRQRMLAEILEPRARELFQMLRDNLRNGGVLEALGAGCVLVGGGAMLPGILDVAESLLRVPARIGCPVRLSRMPQELVRPDFATTIGLLLYRHRSSMVRSSNDQSLRAKLRAMFAGSV